MDPNYVNLCCYHFDADAIEKLRRGLSSNTRRTPHSVANSVHQMLGAYLYCQKHGIRYHSIWEDQYKQMKEDK